MSVPPDLRTTDPFSGIQLLSDEAYRSLGSMEAVEWEAPPAEKPGFREMAPGFVAAVVIAAGAVAIHGVLPDALPLGAAVLAMVFGITLRNAIPLPSGIATGCRWIVSCLIPVAIVMVGAGLDLGILLSEGWRFLGYILSAVLISVMAAVLLGRMLGIETRTSLLIGAGTGICGSSAILAVAPVIEAEEDDILLSVGAINLIGLVAMVACIGLASVIPVPAIEFGILTGTTIHAVPTVAAAAFDHSLEAGQTATLVKMGRVAVLVPFVFAIALAWKRRNPGGKGMRENTGNVIQFVPWFVWGFAATATLGTLGLIPNLGFPEGAVFRDAANYQGSALLSSAGKLLLTLAMAAIGLQVGLRSMLRTGGRAVVLATLVWLIVTAAVGLGLAAF